MSDFMEIPLKVEIKRPEDSFFREMSPDIIPSQPRDMSIKIWTVRDRRLCEYEFWATHLLERPIASSIGEMRVYPVGTIYEEKYLRRLRDHINELLGE